VVLVHFARKHRGALDPVLLFCDSFRVRRRRSFGVHSDWIRRVWKFATSGLAQGLLKKLAGSYARLHGSRSPSQTTTRRSREVTSAGVFAGLTSGVWPETSSYRPHGHSVFCAPCAAASTRATPSVLFTGTPLRTKSSLSLPTVDWSMPSLRRRCLSCWAQ
jgi:hypothetical protein